MEPKNIIGGTPIKNREMKDKPKSDYRRRNAVMLEGDVHYNRLLKEMSRGKEKTIHPQGGSNNSNQ